MSFKQKKFVSKSGRSYTFQLPGVRSVAKINDRIKNKFGVPQDEKLADEMLEHIVVEPRMKVDDFSSFRELGEVIGEAYKFAIGEDDEEVGENGDQQKGS